MIHNIKESGYTVSELAEQLRRAVGAGMGDRRVYVGPRIEVDYDYKKPWPNHIAISVIGVEGTEDEET